MGKVVAVYAMSLDGFIADSGDDVQRLYQWFSNGDTPFPVADRVFMTSAVSAEQYRRLWDSIGAQVTGRRDFDVSRAWGGKHPMGIPCFIVTHNPPPEWTGEGSPFTFVTDGVESAVRQAQAAAGEKNVVLGGSTIAQQCIKAGLVDEIHIDLVPVLLGEGIRLFDHLGSNPVELETTAVLDAPGVTHLKFRVVK